MARTSLPPGFRFHPTDVELIMYYLKKKILGMKLHAETIAEVNIYKFSPWDLPGHSPKWERTDWVIHEYRILDDQVAAIGAQDTYVLCKVFKKNGLGPKNGTQYGAPFKEEEWTDDDETYVNNATTSSTSDVLSPPGLMFEKHSFAMVSLFDPGSTSGMSLIEESPSIYICLMMRWIDYWPLL